MGAESEQFQRVLAAALQLSVVDKLRLIARIADSLVEDLEKSEPHGQVREMTLKGTITADHQLVVQMPEGFPPCEVTVVLEYPDSKTLQETPPDQLKITIQLPYTDAIRQWFTDYQHRQGTNR